MLGIALGGVASGFGDGLGLRDRMDTQRQRRADQRFGEDLRTEAEQAFKESGKSPDQWDQFFTRFAAPRHAARMIERGDLAGAQQWQEWTQNDNVKRASRLFGEGMIAGQTGDMATAMQRFVEAAKIQGYGPDMDITSVEPTENGGWRIAGTGPGGTAFEETFNNQDELLNFASTYLNPESAFELWRQGRQSDRDYRRTVALEGDKERSKLGARTDDAMIRQSLGLRSGTGERAMTHKEAHDILKDSPEYLDATPDERRKMRDREIGATGGDGPQQPRRQIVVDTQTGERIDPDALPDPGASEQRQPPAQRRGVPETGAAEPTAVPTPEAARQSLGIDMHRPRSLEEWERDEAASGAPIPEAIRRGRDAIGAGMERWQQQRDGQSEEIRQQIRVVLDRAVQALARGADPRVIAEALRRVGVPEEQWPPELRG